MLTRNERIIKQIQALHPTFWEVFDESHLHHVPQGAETHFKLIIVSEAFSSLSLVKRHQVVFKLLQSERENGLHALSLHLFTPQQWTTKVTVHHSPACRDGYSY